MSARNKPGCARPELGERLSWSLGRDASMTEVEREHLGGCMACQLERRAFAQTKGSAAAPSAALLRRLRELAQAKRG